MTGLRERQKAARHERILKAAAELFRELGYDRANIEAIACRAEVSIGTIYNYYQNKGDLLLAIVAMEVNEVLNEGEKLLQSPNAAPQQAVSRLLSNYLEHSLVYLSKEMWRQAMAISTRQPESPFGCAYSELDDKLCEQVCRLVEQLAANHYLRDGVDARSVGEVIFNNMNMMFIAFVKDETMLLDTLMSRIERQNKALLDVIAS